MKLRNPASAHPDILPLPPRVNSSGFFLLRQAGQQNISASSGFTLLELVMVIILLGILVASAAPRFIRSADFALEGAAAMIAADIRYAQELAMATHDPKDVVFTIGATWYTVETRDDAVTRTVDLPSRVIIGTTITFTFNPLGEPTAGGGGSVTISAGGGAKTISVAEYTGKVSVS